MIRDSFMVSAMKDSFVGIKTFFFESTFICCERLLHVFFSNSLSLKFCKRTMIFQCCFGGRNHASSYSSGNNDKQVGDVS